MCVATYSKLACLLLALDSILGYALPVEPVSGLNAASLLERDAGDSPDDPIDIFIDCTGQEVICDADCYAVLCAGKPHVLQRDATDANTHRTQSGKFEASPFQSHGRARQTSHTSAHLSGAYLTPSLSK